MSIPDEAVEAAAGAIEYALQTGVGVGDMARDAIEAAAPHLMAEAWEVGMAAAKLAAAGIKPARNPYSANE